MQGHGCGGGILSEAMAKLCASVHGVDVVERSIIVAQRHADRAGTPVCYEVTTAETLASRAGVKVNPLTRRFSLTRNMPVNYMLVAQRAATPS